MSESHSDRADSGSENIEVAEIVSDRPETSIFMKLRSKRAKPECWSCRIAVASLEHQLSSLKVAENNKTVKQALVILGETAEAVISKELRLSMIGKEAFEWVHMKDLSYEERKSVTPSKMFIRE